MVASVVSAVVFLTCSHTAVVRPQSIVFACGDGNFYATSLHWSRWTTTEAVAQGVGHQNDCKPYCAAGHFHAFPLTVRLSHVVSCVRGKRVFAEIAWDGVRIVGIPRAGSETFPCRFLKLKP